MEINNDASTLKLAIQTEVIKKAENVKKNSILSVLDGMEQNIQKAAAKVTGKY